MVIQPLVVEPIKKTETRLKEITNGYFEALLSFIFSPKEM